MTCSERQSSRYLHIIVEYRAAVRACASDCVCPFVEAHPPDPGDRRPLAECADVCFVLYTPYYMDESNYKRPFLRWTLHSPNPVGVKIHGCQGSVFIFFLQKIVFFGVSQQNGEERWYFQRRTRSKRGFTVTLLVCAPL